MNSTKNNCILIVGGIDDNASEIDAFNPKNRKWSLFYNIAKKIREFSCVLIEHKLYLFGGMFEKQVTDSVWLLDLNSKELKPLGSMQKARANSKAVVCNKRIFVIGGVDSQAQPLYTMEEYDIEEDTWKTPVNINFKRYNYAVAVIESKIYIIGGDDEGGASKDVNVYCTVSNKFDELNAMTVNRCDLTAVPLEDCIYAIGGWNDSLVLDAVEKYNPYKKIWENVEKLAKPRKSPCAVIYNNRIICFGNKKSHGIFEFSSSNNEWSKIGKMNNERRRYMAFVWENSLNSDGKQDQIVDADSGASCSFDKENLNTDLSNQNPQSNPIGSNRNLEEKTVIILGGFETGDNSMDTYNPISKKIYLKFLDLPKIFNGFASVVYNKKLLIFGGFNSATDQVQCLDLVTKQLKTNTPSLLEARKFTRVAVVDNHVYVLGGLDSEERELLTVERWSSKETNWKYVRPMISKRIHSAVVVCGDKIYVIGGTIPSEEYEFTNVVEMYCTTTDRWTRLNEMSFCRSSISGVALNNKIYAIGGHTEVGISELVEIFDPVSGTWTQGKELSKEAKVRCAVAYNDKIICFGNQSSLEYDPNRNNYEELNDLKISRVNCNAILVDFDLSNYI
ncbi:uncharacterized protein LOC143915247 isoform X2 [Arctopsyche grandis]|uniref:uncharacterized protein LOC143915247 isoform X2 n=2 Tax=Arctopsyche grandis TaxID=121162 RepID=UPI00406D726B